jgi:DNA-binding CsgD family transcriptional regulator
MATGLAVNKDTVLAIGLNRVGRDFDANDLTLLNIIRPHLFQAFGNAGAVTKMQNELAAFNLMLEQLDRAIISVTPAGRIQWATARAQRVLDEYQLRDKRGSNWLPRTLREWLKRQETGFNSREDLPDPMEPLVVEFGPKALHIRLLRDGQRRLLCLDERRPEITVESLKPLGLSPRETEVLCWVAQGKSNPEVGLILGISDRTVQKHLERIYIRLGLENRHAAITLAMETARP